MSWPFLFALQLSAPGAGGASFDLRTVTPSASCAGNIGDEIVVCGLREPLERDRLKPVPPSDYDKPLVAETGIIGSVRGSATVENFVLPGGIVSNRAMINIKIPF